MQSTHSVAELRRLGVLAAIALLSLAPFPSPAAAQQSGGPGDDDVVTGEAAVEAPELPYPIGPDTTLFTAPRRANGTIDVVAAFYARLGEGIERDENAAVLLLEAYGGRAEGSTMDYPCRELGVEIAPIDGEYFRQEAGNFGPVRPDRFILDLAELERALQAPWADGDCPTVAEWIAANESSLEKVAIAVRRPKYFIPRTDGGEGSWSILLPDVQMSRSVARCLVARAMSRVQAGDDEGAWQDVLTTFRLARTVAQGPTLIERLVGYAIDSVACQAALRAARMRDVMIPDHDDLLEDLADLEPLPKLADAVGMERLMFIDAVQLLAVGGDDAERTTAGLFGADLSPVLPILRRIPVDWGTVLRRGGAQYERVGAASTQGTYRDRLAALEALGEDIQTQSQAASDRLVDPAILARRSIFPKQGARETSEDLADVLVGVLIPASRAMLGAEVDAANRHDLLPVAVAIDAYRRRHGEWPESCDDLPGDPRMRPFTDRFTDEPFHWKPLDGGVAVYYVGRNGQDDGGPDREGSDDQGFVLPAEPQR